MTFDVDVLMPVYNRVRYVEASIRSVLAEEGVRVRLIVVDDGSTDGSRELVQEFAAREPRLTILYGEHRGVSAVRNRALSAIAAPYISFLDSDDLFAPGKLARQIGKLEANRDLAAVIGHRSIFRGDSRAPWHECENLERKVDICLASATFRRSVFERFSSFDEELLFGEDLDLYLKLIEANWPLLVEVDDAVFYRRHADNMTNDKVSLHASLMRAHHKSMQRRRQGTVGPVKLFFYQDYSVDTIVDRSGRREPPSVSSPEGEIVRA